MFQMLENLPLTGITSFLGICLVLIFFVTSSDSGSLVVDSITAGGKWMHRGSADVLGHPSGSDRRLSAGGRGLRCPGAIQAVAITVGLPFTMIMIVMMISLYLGLQDDYRKMKF